MSQQHNARLVDWSALKEDDDPLVSFEIDLGGACYQVEGDEECYVLPPQEWLDGVGRPMWLAHVVAPGAGPHPPQAARGATEPAEDEHVEVEEPPEAAANLGPGPPVASIRERLKELNEQLWVRSAQAARRGAAQFATESDGSSDEDLPPTRGHGMQVPLRLLEILGTILHVLSLPPCHSQRQLRVHHRDCSRRRWAMHLPRADVT